MLKMNPVPVAGEYQIFVGDKLLLDKCEFSGSFLFKARGLMGRKSLPQGRGILLCPCNSIHMFFMWFPIDALFLDRHWRIVRVCSRIQPWQFSPIVWNSRAVIELPAGLSEKAAVKVGEQVHPVHVGRRS
jgi:uncharacterized protein